MSIPGNVLSYLNPYHINAQNAINLWAFPQAQFNWHAVIPNLPAGIDTGISRLIPLGIGSTIDNIKRSAQLSTIVRSVNLPKKVIETADAFFFGRKRKVPMAVTYEDNVFELVFEEYEHQAVVTTFTRWIDLIENSIANPLSGISGALSSILGTTNSKNGSNYSEFEKYTSDIFVFMEQANGVPNNFINIKRCFPINISQANSLDYSGNQSILYTVSFAFNEYSIISREDIL